MQEDNLQGYVYILTNPSFKEDWVKIGKSLCTVNEIPKDTAKEKKNLRLPFNFCMMELNIENTVVDWKGNRNIFFE